MFTHARTVLVALSLMGLLTTGCASPPKPAVCAAVGAALGGGVGATMNDTDDHDRHHVARGAAGAVLIGSAGYFICRAMAGDGEAEAAAPATDSMADSGADTAVAEPVEERVAPAVPAPVAERIVLRGVNFDFDKSEIRPDAAVILDEAARILAGRGSAPLQVMGHTDATGPDAYNQGLSERRANSVRDYLVGAGIDAGRISTAGAGESQPIATNDTREGRALNRRVELNVLE